MRVPDLNVGGRVRGEISAAPRGGGGRPTGGQESNVAGLAKKQLRIDSRAH